jgi:hypothetical protein
MRAWIDGRPLGPVAVPSCGEPHRLTWNVPGCSAGRGDILVRLEVSRAGPVGTDKRELGFGVLSVEVED